MLLSLEIPSGRREFNSSRDCAPIDLNVENEDFACHLKLIVSRLICLKV